MRLSAKINYACRAVLELSLHYHDTVPVQLNTIYKAQKISKKFLVQLLLKLKDAGIVDSSRGMGGGYFLTRHPSNIKLADVFRAVDSHILEKPKTKKFTNESEKMIAAIWNRANALFAGQFDMNYENLIAQLRGFYVDYQI